ncbi:MAG: tetratricopeptide repeat protein [Oscillospiraceae bacterium]|nr:tetratricopeptide repeat protein [Oscillospiraceae bacterium]
MNGLRPEDYLDPGCIFCKPDDGSARPVDLRRCFTRLDEYLNRNDYEAARRHLEYWKAEALANRDLRGLLSIENERMGLFRKLGDEAAAEAALASALELVEQTGLDGSVTAATTWLNAATVRKRFGRADEALPLYEKARVVYEAALPADDGRLGGLYNNMALALTDLGRYAEARTLYEKALTVMRTQPRGALELAITELNLANLAEAEQGLLEAEAEIEARLDRARALLEEPSLPRDGYYAFVCEKCAPSFDYYGRFMDARELKERSEKIYAGS